jgi:hypothetical protein
MIAKMVMVVIRLNHQRHQHSAGIAAEDRSAAAKESSASHDVGS